MFRLINKLKNRKGFTLIELIVVLAVLVVIAAIAVPRFLGVQEKAKESADQTTVDSIARAAELYYAQTSDSTITLAELESGNYIDSFTSLQSESTTGATITLDAGTGKVTVKIGTFTSK